MEALNKKNSKEFWNGRFSEMPFAKEPSPFLMEQAEALSPGAKVLDLGCGTGRNAVALALKKFSVKAIDFSDVAMEKAQAFAKESGVEIEFKSMDLDFFIPELLAYDAIASIDFKPPPTLLNNLIRGLKKNGKLIMEAPLLQAMKDRPELESFECFQPGELLKVFQKPGLNFRILFYSELDQKHVQLIAMKTEML